MQHKTEYKTENGKTKKVSEKKEQTKKQSKKHLQVIQTMKIHLKQPTKENRT